MEEVKTLGHKLGRRLREGRSILTFLKGSSE